MNAIIENYQYLKITGQEKELTLHYHKLNLNYPKFYKMDGLSKLGFLASEMLLTNEPNRFQPMKNRGVICFNRSSSLENDIHYDQTIRDKKNYFPSPSLFVYTLPNIVTGEIAIRNKYLGESSFYLCENFNSEYIYEIIMDTFQDEEMNSILTGWIEYSSLCAEALMILVKRQDTCEVADKIFSADNMNRIMNSAREKESIKIIER